MQDGAGIKEYMQDGAGIKEYCWMFAKALVQQLIN
jgi:hypothetical protein